jgi:hypothetical protein
VKVNRNIDVYVVQAPRLIRLLAGLSQFGGLNTGPFRWHVTFDWLSTILKPRVPCPCPQRSRDEPAIQTD